MSEFWNDILLTFVPLFIVVDAVGNLPFVISITDQIPAGERKKVVNLSVITASLLGLVFLFMGKLILDLMGISVGAFAIAGGIILLLFAIRYMTSGHMVEVIKEEMVAVVPIGTPLTMGPATITTLILLVNQFPVYIVLFSFGLNMLATWLIFKSNEWFIHYMGQGGLKAMSRIFSLFLAAIAISMIIKGLRLEEILGAVGGGS